ncbi:SDR family oxidoreductase [Aureibacter tunicatorum]|uniref:NAD(P)-dependent dehydrogenase (Short-subunit alcohol dehydrogenase family) n=1 Tax=Aureibacter tunicatorum TaxID=866807 RepID=A0AAE4BU30_9BACT|nr:SDR family oxidoreductase [Aureibacter tunicatorum]MDR6241361.1 NAD(P)-dependent dehydrogenase (short-subunit alcohol dehydrogenase family) [Aureibacter tunicatorum]BDD06794.1 short-chain dehydrogenase/reductase [Aureibacter tunicatorum]
MNILITGGNSGIGRCIAEHLAEKGHTVLATSRNPSKAKHSKFDFVELDITSESSIKNLVDELQKRRFEIDVLINNAGIGICGAFEDTPIDLAREQIDTNFWGAASMTKAFLPQMRAQKKGRIIFITSLAGLIGVPYQSYYAASKHALEGLAKSIRHEVKEFGVSVSCVEPGFFRSNLHHSFKYAPHSNGQYDSSREKALEVFSESIANAPEPLEIAKLVERIIGSKSPKMSYKAGNDGKFLPFLQFLSYRLFEIGTRNKFRLP